MDPVNITQQNKDIDKIDLEYLLEKIYRDDTIEGAEPQIFKSKLEDFETKISNYESHVFLLKFNSKFNENVSIYILNTNLNFQQKRPPQYTIDD